MVCPGQGFKVRRLRPVITVDEFGEEAARFLDRTASLRTAQKTGWGEGSDRVGLFSEKTPEQERADVDAAKAWRQQVFDAGFGWITGPEQYGGRGLPQAYED